MRDRTPKAEALDPLIDYGRGVFRFAGKDLVLIGAHVHEVIGRRRDHIGQWRVMISARCRKATEDHRLTAKRGGA